MNKDFAKFIAEPNLQNAKRIIKYSESIYAQCVFGKELKIASEIVSQVSQ